MTTMNETLVDESGRAPFTVVVNIGESKATPPTVILNWMAEVKK
jgi:hypothetical protein